jgi:subtilisin family serine protease
MSSFICGHAPLSRLQENSFHIVPRKSNGCVRFPIGIALLLLVPVAYCAGDDFTPRIGGDYAETFLGDGTGVVVGIIDSGVDDTHPALAGVTSDGLPRMKAEANFVPEENTTDDLAGHGTAVAGAILSRDSTHFGVATDARYVSARVMGSDNAFNTDEQVINGVGFALQQGSNILNMSLGYFDYGTSGDTPLALMADYIERFS